MSHDNQEKSGEGVHFISALKEHPGDAWIKKYIFPGGVVLSLREMLSCAIEDNFHTMDVENLRLYYNRTLLCWERNFQENIGKVREMFDERFVRMWDLYLSACAATFHNGGNAYAQVIRDGNGRVLSLYPLLPDKMEVDRDEHGQLFYTYTRNTDENPNFSEYGRVRLKPEDVANFCGLGVTQRGRAGLSFDTPQLGIRAQVQHLKAYASTDKLLNERIDPRLAEDNAITSLSRFEAATGKHSVTIVMDKGFFSTKNVNFLLGEKQRPAHNFLISMPFTSAFAKKQVESERKDIDCVENTIVVNGYLLRAVT